MDKDPFCCDICLVLYSTKASPRILPCGHSCCTSCLKKIITTNKNCHMCRMTLTEEDERKYLVNFSLLGACDKFYNKKRRIDCVKQRLSTILDKHVKLVELAQVKAVKLDQLIIDGRKLQEFSLMKDSSLNVSEVDAAIEDFEKRMTDVVECFNIDFDTHSDCKIDFHSSQCSDSKEFLAKIQRDVAIGRQVAAVARINGEEKFAKMKISDGKLFLHALDKWDSADGEVTRVGFQDLLENLLPLNKVLYGFLLLDYDPNKAPHLAIIEIDSTASIIQGIQFLKLCSGELGISYKGVSCVQERTSLDSNTPLKSATPVKSAAPLKSASKTISLFNTPPVLHSAETSTSIFGVPPVLHSADLSTRIFSRNIQPVLPPAEIPPYLSVMRTKNFDFQTKDKYQLLSGKIPQDFIPKKGNLDDRYLFLKTDGSFELLHYKPGVKGTCIGRIMNCKFSPKSLENLTIINCGIAFQLPI